MGDPDGQCSRSPAAPTTPGQRPPAHHRPNNGPEPRAESSLIEEETLARSVVRSHREFNVTKTDRRNIGARARPGVVSTTALTSFERQNIKRPTPNAQSITGVS